MQQRKEAKGMVFHTPQTFGDLTRHRFIWTSDSAGDVTYFAGRDLIGEAVQVEYSNSNGGGETYSVTLIDDASQDWLLGFVSSKSTGTNGRAALVQETVSSAQARPAPLPSGLWLIVDCSASAVRSGVVDIWTKGA